MLLKSCRCNNKKLTNTKQNVPKCLFVNLRFHQSNIDVGNYSLTVTASGFETFSVPTIPLTARESHRVDAALPLGAENQTVTVEAEAENVITTEVSNLAETKMGDELVDLPVAI